MRLVCYVGIRLVIWRKGEGEGLWRRRLRSPQQHKEGLRSNLMNSMNIQAFEWQGEDSHKGRRTCRGVQEAQMHHETDLDKSS